MHDADMEDLVTMVGGGMSLEAAAEELGFSAAYLYAVLRDGDVLRRLRKARDAKVIEMYQHRPAVPILEILTRFDISQATLYRILKQNDVPRTRRKPSPPPEEREQLADDIERRYRQGDTVSAIATALDCSIAHLYKVLRTRNVVLRSQQPPQVFTPSLQESE